MEEEDLARSLNRLYQRVERLEGQLETVVERLENLEARGGWWMRGPRNRRRKVGRLYEQDEGGNEK